LRAYDGCVSASQLPNFSVGVAKSKYLTAVE